MLNNMNTCNGTQESSLQIKQNDRFFSRLLSKETSSSIGAPSFRVYYGGENVNVPFMWESKPGTPKHHTLDHDHQQHDEDSILPPLTPPPSYYTTNEPIKRKGRSNFFLNFLPRITFPKKPRGLSSSSSSRSSSSSSEASESSWKSRSTWSPPTMLGKCQSSTVRSILFDHGMDEDEIGSMSPTSTLCFGLKMPRS